jgi:excisionase family DNA binding protein
VNIDHHANSHVSALSAPEAPTNRLLLTPREAAAALSISERTLWELTRQGVVPCVRLRRSVRYDVDDLRALVAAKKCNRGN